MSGFRTGASVDIAQPVEIDFEGRRIRCRSGETIAAALTAAGEAEFREAASGARRGLFCGMGVCQECLVEIDGVSTARACMTKVTAPISVKRLPALQRLGGKAAGPIEDSVFTPDVLVIGSGVAGLNAALAASACGAQVTLIDERPEPGGQFFKQPIDGLGIARDAQAASGRALIDKVKASPVQRIENAMVWGAFEPLTFSAVAGRTSVTLSPKKTVICAGAYERPIIVPGWTLPNVMTTGSAQTLLRSYGVSPGRRILIAGNGPLNLQAACELSDAGAEIVAIAELSARPGLQSIGAAARMLSSSPSLVAKGLSYLAKLRSRKVPIFHGAALRSVARTPAGLRAELSSAQAFDVDVVCVGYGFHPASELLLALGCRSAGDLAIARDENCETSVPGLYAAGDCAQINGARVAAAEGTIAGYEAAASLGFKLSPEHAAHLRQARIRRERERRFQAGLWQLFAAKAPYTEFSAPDTLVCRCENVPFGKIVEALDNGTLSAGLLKRETRAGMGRCQGRYCGPVIAALIAARQGRPIGEAERWMPRPPAKPVRIGDITGIP